MLGVGAGLGCGCGAAAATQGACCSGVSLAAPRLADRELPSLVAQPPAESRLRGDFLLRLLENIAFRLAVLVWTLVSALQVVGHIELG